MTNGWIDIKNTDMMLIMGGNPAENHLYLPKMLSGANAFEISDIERMNIGAHQLAFRT